MPREPRSPSRPVPSAAAPRGRGGRRAQRALAFTDRLDASHRVEAYLERTGLAACAPRVVPLTGDASDRRYVRIVPPDAPSFVLALYAAPFTYETLPFVNVARLLAEVPLPIPTILGHADDLGILALQDLGDLTLQAHLGAASPEQHRALYLEAVAHLVRLQQRGAALASPRYLPYGIAFDAAKFAWELEFFLTHFLEGYRGVRLPPAARAALAEEFARLAAELATEPRVLCHRDYHSRNLMWHEGQLYLIDFQDARMGPATYDLASLIRDAYVEVPPDLADELIARFLALTDPGTDRAEFRRRLDLMALQRTLKALGTFGYQTTVRQNPVYIQYMPRTLRHVRETLLGSPRFARLYALLAGALDELQ